MTEVREVPPSDPRSFRREWLDGWRARLSSIAAVRVSLQIGCVVALIGGLTATTAYFFPRSPSEAYPAYSAVLVIVTLRLGSGAGFLTLGLSTVLLAYYLLVGEGFAVSDPVEATGLVAFVGANALIIASLGAVRSRYQRAEGTCMRLAAEKSAKAALLSELSHRIGNDLTTLMSLAELQVLAASHAETQQALTGMVDRLYVFGCVYKRLSVDTAQAVAIDMPTFLGGLCDDLRMANLGMRAVSLEIQCDPCTMPAGRAALVGLVLNETITNALKHAFPDDLAGAIHVRFEREQATARSLSLVVADDGVGLDPVAGQGSRMGQRLLRALASQLQGSFSLERSNNLTVARLRLPE